MNASRQFNVSNLVCPYCDEPALYGAEVCRGCQAEIAYGAIGLEGSYNVSACITLGLLVAAVFFTIHLLAYIIIPILCVIFLAPRMKDDFEGRVRYLRKFRYR